MKASKSIFLATSILLTSTFSHAIPLRPAPDCTWIDTSTIEKIWIEENPIKPPIKTPNKYCYHDQQEFWNLPLKEQESRLQDNPLEFLKECGPKKPSKSNDQSNGHWEYLTNNNGYWDCPNCIPEPDPIPIPVPEPVPESTSMILFGLGIALSALYLRKN